MNVRPCPECPETMHEVETIRDERLTSDVRITHRYVCPQGHRVDVSDPPPFKQQR